MEEYPLHINTRLTMGPEKMVKSPNTPRRWRRRRRDVARIRKQFFKPISDSNDNDPQDPENTHSNKGSKQPLAFGSNEIQTKIPDEVLYDLSNTLQMRWCDSPASQLTESIERSAFNSFEMNTPVSKWMEENKATINSQLSSKEQIRKLPFLPLDQTSHDTTKTVEERQDILVLGRKAEEVSPRTVLHPRGSLFRTPKDLKDFPGQKSRVFSVSERYQDQKTKTEGTGFPYKNYSLTSRVTYMPLEDALHEEETSNKYSKVANQGHIQKSTRWNKKNEKNSAVKLKINAFERGSGTSEVESLSGEKIDFDINIFPVSFPSSFPTSKVFFARKLHPKDSQNIKKQVEKDDKNKCVPLVGQTEFHAKLHNLKEESCARSKNSKPLLPPSARKLFRIHQSEVIEVSNSLVEKTPHIESENITRNTSLLSTSTPTPPASSSSVSSQAAPTSSSSVSTPNPPTSSFSLSFPTSQASSTASTTNILAYASSSSTPRIKNISDDCTASFSFEYERKDREAEATQSSEREDNGLDKPVAGNLFSNFSSNYLGSQLNSEKKDPGTETQTIHIVHVVIPEETESQSTRDNDRSHQVSVVKSNDSQKKNYSHEEDTLFDDLESQPCSCSLSINESFSNRRDCKRADNRISTSEQESIKCLSLATNTDKNTPIANVDNSNTEYTQYVFATKSRESQNMLEVDEIVSRQEARSISLSETCDDESQYTGLSLVSVQIFEEKEKMEVEVLVKAEDCKLIVSTSNQDINSIKEALEHRDKEIQQQKNIIVQREQKIEELERERDLLKTDLERAKMREESRDSLEFIDIFICF